MSTQRAVLVRISTGEIINNNAYIDASEPRTGLVDLKYYVYYEPTAVPDYDPRYFILNTVKTMQEGVPHPDFPDYDQYLISYTTTKRDIEEIKIQVENAENEANNHVVPLEKQIKVLFKGVNVLFRNLEGSTLTKKEKRTKKRVNKIAQSLLKNEAKKEAKIADIEAGLEPDLDDGWEKTEVLEEETGA